MPTLKSEKVSYTKVEYRNLNSFITEVYGHDFECVADMEWSNDEKHSILVVKEKLNEYNQSLIDGFVNHGRYNYMLPVILTDLCNKGLLEPGEYLIDVSW